MTTTGRVLRPPADFMCVKCGTARGAKSRTTRAKLLCAGCGAASLHVMVGVRDEGGELRPWLPVDEWREVANRKQDVGLTTLGWLESVYEQFGIDIRYGVKLGRLDSGTRGLYATSHNLSNGGHVWGLEVSADASLDGRIYALRAGLGDLVSERFDYWQIDGPSHWTHGSKRYGDFIAGRQLAEWDGGA